MPLIAFLLFTHARLQDNACAMSHYSYVVPLKSRNQQRNPEIRKSAGNQEIRREIRKSVTALEITGKTAKSRTPKRPVSDPSTRTVLEASVFVALIPFYLQKRYT